MCLGNFEICRRSSIGRAPDSQLINIVMGLKMSNCLKCNKPLSEQQKKFCSRSCAVSYNNIGKVINGKETPKCILCQKKVSNSYNVYCSKECEIKHKREKSDKKIKSGLNTDSGALKSYLLRKRKRECSICKNTEWMGKEIPLIMDHIDGNSENNDLGNLRLICGNCDMQLPTFAGRNRGNGRHYRRLRYKEGKSS